MPAHFSISTGDVLTLARLDPANAADVADADAVLSGEQEAIELTLRPSALADTRLAPLLARQVAKLLAAEVLAVRARQDGASGTFVGGGITVASVPDHAAVLRAEARFYLAPFLRRTVGVALPCGEPAGGQTAQNRQFGPGELGRGVKDTG